MPGLGVIDSCLTSQANELPLAKSLPKHSEQFRDCCRPTSAPPAVSAPTNSVQSFVVLPSRSPHAKSRNRAGQAGCGFFATLCGCAAALREGARSQTSRIYAHLTFFNDSLRFCRATSPSRLRLPTSQLLIALTKLLSASCAI